MSIWYSKREKDGKKSLVGVDIPFPLIITMLGLFAAIIGTRLLKNPPQLVIGSFYLVAFGFLLLLISKVSLFAKGIWISWGYLRMSKFFRFVYIFGYISIGIGIMIILVAYKSL